MPRASAHGCCPRAIAAYVMDDAAVWKAAAVRREAEKQLRDLAALGTEKVCRQFRKDWIVDDRIAADLALVQTSLLKQACRMNKYGREAQSPIQQDCAREIGNFISLSNQRSKAHSSEHCSSAQRGQHRLETSNLQDGHMPSSSSGFVERAPANLYQNDAIIAALLAEEIQTSTADRSNAYVSISRGKDPDAAALRTKFARYGPSALLQSCENDAVLAALLADGCSTGEGTKRANLCENDSVLATLLNEDMHASNTSSLIVDSHGSVAQPMGHGTLRAGENSSLCENDAALALLLNEEIVASIDYPLAETMTQNPDLQPSRPSPATHLSQPSQVLQTCQEDSPISSIGGQNTSENECGICMDSFANACLVPCGHTDFCVQCVGRLNPGLCPICRTPIDDIIRIVRPSNM